MVDQQQPAPIHDLKLERALRDLPSSIEPTRDLWPEIEGRLKRRRFGALPWSTAAAAMAAAAAWLVMIRPATEPAPAADSGLQAVVQDLVDLGGGVLQPDQQAGFEGMDDLLPGETDYRKGGGGSPRCLCDASATTRVGCRPRDR